MKHEQTEEPANLAIRAIAHYLDQVTDVTQRLMLLQDYVWKSRSIPRSGTALTDRSFLERLIPRDLVLGNSGVAIVQARGKRRKDVAIVTITSTEHKMMMLALGLTEESATHFADHSRYWETSIYSKRTGRLLNLVVTNVGEQRNAACQSAIARLLVEYEVNSAILVGIAAGVKKKVRKGDVVAATEVIDYEGAKLEPSARKKRPKTVQSIRAMKSSLGFYSPEASRIKNLLDAHVAYLQQLEVMPIGYSEEVRPKYATAIIASGEKLIVDGSLANMRDEYHDKLWAADMESYGFAYACVDVVPSIPWLVLRGISDYGEPEVQGLGNVGGDAEVEKGDDWQFLSALAASLVARDFLELEYMAPELPHQELDASGESF